MAKSINTDLGSSLLKFTFSDADGDVIAHFRMNPADVRLASRCEEVAAFFEEKKNTAPENATLADVVAYNDMLEEKVCYLLGYDAKPTLFGILSATTILADGDLFAFKVLDKIVDAVEPEIRKRKAKSQAAIGKYTAKYQ